MSFASRLALLLAGLAGSTAAVAGDKPKPIVPDWKQSHLAEGDRAITSVYILATCARNHMRAASEALLASAPGSAEEAALIRTAMPSGETECPIRAGSMRIRSSTLIRGAIAEALYNGDSVKPRGAATLALDEALRPSRGATGLAIGRWVARCAVRRDLLSAHAVVRTNPGSAPETRALRALRPTLLACLPPGERLAVSRVLFRALIAEELYQASLSFKEAFRHA